MHSHTQHQLASQNRRNFTDVTWEDSSNKGNDADEDDSEDGQSFASADSGTLIAALEEAMHEEQQGACSSLPLSGLDTITVANRGSHITKPETALVTMSELISSNTHNSVASTAPPSSNGAPGNEDHSEQLEKRKATSATPARTGNRKRLEFLDGIRGVAAVLILTHHYVDNTIQGLHPEVMAAGTPQYILKNGEFGLALLMAISGRAIVLSFLTKMSKWRTSLSPDSELTTIYLAFAASIVRRSFRLAAPVFFIALMQQQLCIHGYMDVALEAREYLNNNVLGVPYWCRVGNIWNFFMEMFTYPNPQYLLDLGSSLWSMYVFLWGSYYIYLISAIVAHIPSATARLCVHVGLIVFNAMTYNFNLVFSIGVLITDLDAAGILKKLQKGRWWIMIPLKLTLAAFFLSLLLTDVVGKAIDFGLYPYMLRDGVLGGRDSQGTRYWPILYSFGIYCLHNTVIYTIVTRLVIAFRDSGWPYWTNMSITYVLFVVVSFVFAVVFYNVVDKPVQKITVTAFEFFFKPRTNSKGKGQGIEEDGQGSANVANAGTASFHDLRVLPGRLVKAFRSTPKVIGDSVRSFAAKWNNRFARCGSNVTFAMNFMRGRNDAHKQRMEKLARLQASVSAEEDRFIDPSQPFYSTEWLHGTFSASSASSSSNSNFKSDVENATYSNPSVNDVYTQLLGAEATQKAKRTARILEGYNVLTFLSLCYPRIPPSPRKGRNQHNDLLNDIRRVIRPSIRNFYILTVTKGTNEEAVRHSYAQMKDFEKLHPAIRVVVLSDEPYAFPDLGNVVVPKDYKTDEGKGRYKARALDYFRKHMRLTRHDWTLHMDEESTIDAESLRRCFDFIRYDKADWGQGVILYNSNKDLYWKNPFFAVADAIRVGDDLARFHIQYSLFRRPIFGAHGSFLLLNGQVENIVTWDFATLAEDFEFSHKAWELGYTCGPIHGFVREQSPQNIRDFMKQRRRWYMGIRDLKGMYGLPKISLILWTIGVYGLIGTVINIPFSIWVDGSATPIWIAIGGNLNFACLYWLYLFGIVFQEVDNGTPAGLMLIRVMMSIVLQPFVTVAEAAAVIWAIKSEDRGKFEVIRK
ncbi:hypothetical protein HK102_000348 [Quaeritorhiza haematococci]|nr:hypothetical protein HK102_000348 [Quaeritorhiza haematococci]